MNTSAWGCLAGDGPGFGEPATSVTNGGSGGSYAGAGGLPSPSEEAIKSSDNKTKIYGKYDSMSVLEGSGGGTGL